VGTLSSTPRLFAFLRAINVGGRNVSMAELRRVFERRGLKEVETFIASGNVIFRSDAIDLRALELSIGDGLRRALGYEVSTFIRTEEELQSIAKHKPFTAAQLKGAQALNVGFLSGPPDRNAKKVIAAFTTESDAFHLHGREVYWLCRTRQSDSKFNNVRFEKSLNTRATWRGMTTITRVATKYL
jgi:uncharacterized protein (DUF1697 family)